jgi:hypothetical protein
MSSADIDRLCALGRAPTFLLKPGGKIMRSRSAPKPHSAAQEEKHAISPADVPSRIHKEAPGHDDESSPGFSIYGDPLFGMAIASVIMFAVLAALMTLS